jgi:hypothetical protein
MYMPHEHFALLLSLSSGNKNDTFDFLIDQGLIPVSSRRSVYKMLNKVKGGGKVPIVWNKKGPSFLFTKEELKELMIESSSS